jgi:hypothetical protein
MSLPALNWKLISAHVVPSSSYNPPTILDMFYTIFSSSTYIDGTVRTPGTDIAWTFTKVTNSLGSTEAIYGYPPTNPMGQRVIFAGSTGSVSPLPTISSGSKLVTNLKDYVGVGLAKNAGSFTSWNSANPFTTGSFSGYNVFVITPTSTGYTWKFIVYESADGIICEALIPDSVGVDINYFLVGGLVDPETGDVTVDAESDGKLYVLGSGLGAGPFGSHDLNTTGTSASNAFAHYYNEATSTFVSRSKMLCFVPGSGSYMSPMSRYTRNLQISSVYSSASGKIVKLPYFLGASTFTGLPNSTYTDPAPFWGGRLREVWITKNTPTANTIRANGKTIGYTLGKIFNSANTTFLLSSGSI